MASPSSALSLLLSLVLQLHCMESVELVFVCEPGNEISTDFLCDGFNDCGQGNDETTSLCENK
jgi:hypothetical protein